VEEGRTTLERKNVQHAGMVQKLLLGVIRGKLRICIEKDYAR